MKVKDLLTQLSEMDPEENILAIIITKEEFDYAEDDEVELTQSAWDGIVEEYMQAHEFHNLYESIGIAVAEIAEAKEEDD